MVNTRLRLRLLGLGTFEAVGGGFLFDGVARRRAIRAAASPGASPLLAGAPSPVHDAGMVRIPRRIPHRGNPDDGTLARRYPEWFALGAVAVPAGWVALVERLFADLDATLSETERAELRVASVKERGGRLTVELYEAVPGARRLIDDAAKAAARICQSCGAPGRHKAFAGWSATLCAACRKRLGAIRIGG